MAILIIIENILAIRQSPEHYEIFAKRVRFVNDWHLTKSKKLNISFPHRYMLYLILDSFAFWLKYD